MHMLCKGAPVANQFLGCHDLLEQYPSTEVSNKLPGSHKKNSQKVTLTNQDGARIVQTLWFSRIFDVWSKSVMFKKSTRAFISSSNSQKEEF